MASRIGTAGPAVRRPRVWIRYGMHGSGRTGGGHRTLKRDRARMQQPDIEPGIDVPVQRDEVAAVAYDGEQEVRPQLLAWQDAEVATDIGEYSADRAATHFRGEVVGAGW